MAIPGVPTLKSRHKPILTSKEQIAGYLISFLFANPGSTSAMNEGEMMSWRKLVETYGSNDPNELANQISSMLTSTMNNYFPNEDIKATCEVEEENGYGEDGKLLGTYSLAISIRDGNENSIIPMSRVRISGDGLNYKFY